jgi:hypothetical protein
MQPVRAELAAELVENTKLSRALRPNNIQHISHFIQQPAIPLKQTATSLEFDISPLALAKAPKASRRCGLPVIASPQLFARQDKRESRAEWLVSGVQTR